MAGTAARRGPNYPSPVPISQRRPIQQPTPIPQADPARSAEARRLRLAQNAALPAARCPMPQPSVLPREGVSAERTALITTRHSGCSSAQPKHCMKTSKEHEVVMPIVARS